jgi:hypothetical protein
LIQLVLSFLFNQYWTSLSPPCIAAKVPRRRRLGISSELKSFGFKASHEILFGQPPFLPCERLAVPLVLKQSSGVLSHHWLGDAWMRWSRLCASIQCCFHAAGQGQGFVVAICLSAILRPVLRISIPFRFAGGRSGNSDVGAREVSIGKATHFVPVDSLCRQARFLIQHMPVS